MTTISAGRAEPPRRRRRLTQRVHTAYHEAGHAAIAHALGCRVKRVSIIPDDDTWGRVSHSIPSWFHELQYNVTPSREIKAHQHIMICLAGAAAIAVHAGRQTWNGAEGDIRQAYDLADCLTSGPKESRALVAWLWTRTRAQTARPQTWSWVEGIAQALLSHGDLTKTQCGDILSRATQDHFNATLEHIQVTRDKQDSGTDGAGDTRQ